MLREPIKIIGDILKELMALTDDQILIYNQDFKLPNTSGLFILLQENGKQPYSSTNTFIPADEGEEGGQESVSLLMQENYTINVISKDDTARLRKEEALMAFSSNFAREIEEEYQFKIARISNGFTNVSELEGAGMLNRFAINISLLAHYNITRDTPYYDTFTNQIETD